MRNTKKKFAFFTIPEYEKEQEWLRKQHNNGWKLISATAPCIYTFEKCQPEDVVYQLDYNQDGIQRKAEYVQMFEDCGWEYIVDMVGYSYFRKPVKEMNGKEEIFCDDESRLDMTRRVFRGRMVPLLVIFFLIIIPQLIVNMNSGDIFRRSMGWFYVALLVFYIILFCQFGIQYIKLKNKIRK